jgi:outer membrane protein assembly factor BamB
VRTTLAVVASAVVGLVLAVSAALSTPPGAWQVFHFDLAHTGVNPHERVLRPGNVSRLRVRWQSKVAKANFGIVNSSVAVGSDAVLVGSGDGYLYSFERRDGAPRWRARTGKGVQSSPAISEGVVYVGSNDGYLYAIRAKSGVRVWRTKVGLLVGSSSPLVVGGIVYVATLTDVQGGGELYAVDAESGTVQWSADLGSSGTASSPSFVSGLIYIGNSNGEVLVYPDHCSTPCDPLWRYELGSGLEVGTPVAASGRVFVSADSEGGSELFALPVQCPIDGPCRPIWHADTVTPFTFSTPAVWKGVVYVQGFKLYAFRTSCGTGGAKCAPLWQAEVPGASSPVVANGVVYTGSNKGRLYAFRTGCGSGGKTCRPLYRGPPSGGTPFASSPAVISGKVYYGAFTHMRAFALGR